MSLFSIITKKKKGKICVSSQGIPGPQNSGVEDYCHWNIVITPLLIYIPLGQFNLKYICYKQIMTNRYSSCGNMSEKDRRHVLKKD